MIESSVGAGISLLGNHFLTKKSKKQLQNDISIIKYTNQLILAGYTNVGTNVKKYKEGIYLEFYQFFKDKNGNFSKDKKKLIKILSHPNTLTMYRIAAIPALIILLMLPPNRFWAFFSALFFSLRFRYFIIINMQFVSLKRPINIF